MRYKASFVLISFSVFAFSSCFQLFEPGPASVVKEITNPDKTKKAVLFLKGGNATVADSYQISILDADESLDDTAVGNTFTCDDDHGKGYPDSTTIKIYWTKKDQLSIKYEKHIRTFIKENKVDGVEVSYDTY